MPQIEEIATTSKRLEELERLNEPISKRPGNSVAPSMKL
jgi:hypothetical protein